MASALIALVIGLWEHFEGKSVAAFWMLFATVLLFWIGAYKAWTKKDDELLASR